MNAQTESFWPADIGIQSIITPVAILREQASMLAGRTKGLVEGRVSTEVGRDSRIYHSFELVAPALGGYRYELFRISHSVLLYPLQIDADSTIGDISLSELGTMRAATLTDIFGTPKVLKDEGEFKQWLKEALSSRHTRSIVNSLLAQSMEADL